MNSERANTADLPPHLRSILDDLDKSDQEARRIVTGLSDEHANWRPVETAWSIAQCLDHLGRTNTVYAAALLKAVQDARADQSGGDGSVVSLFAHSTRHREESLEPRRRLFPPLQWRAARCWNGF